MAGHSKWSNIKHKKGAADAKRGKLFTKLIREITVAARLGGGDPSGNPRLRDAIAEARSNNMPRDNIDRAIKKATGEQDGASLEEIVYEGYGPGGVAMMIESLTDNKNRTVADVRSRLTKSGGSMGENGSVGWIFSKKGLIVVSKEKASEEQLMEVALEAGAEDIKDEGDIWEVLTEQSEFSAVCEALEKSKIAFESASVTAIPSTSVELKGEAAGKMLKLIDSLEDLDDVQKVHTNFDISEEEYKKLDL